MRKYSLLFAVAVLAIALFYGQYNNKVDDETVKGYYKQILPAATSFEKINDRAAKAVDNGGNVLGYVGISSHVGYRGPMIVGTSISADGNIKDVHILDHKETPSYIKRITQEGFFRQFTTKQVTDSLVLDQDIDRISGATLSTRAITNSVHDIGHIIATQEFKQKPKEAEVNLKIGLKEIIVALIFTSSIFLPRIKALAKHRIIFLMISMVTLGFWLNRPLTMVHISSLFMGYFPSINDNMIWYIVLIGALLPTLLTGKNTYCTFVCPFGALQETTQLISKANFPMGKYQQLFRRIRDLFLFLVLFMAFINLNPSKASYDPFGTIFGLNGSSFAWNLIFVVLVASFFYRRFWCMTFCPVGAFIDKVAAFGRFFKDKINIVLQKRQVGNK